MKYIWILMLISVDVIWLISSIINIIYAIRYAKNKSQKNNIYDFIFNMIYELDTSVIGFIVTHLIILFAISLAIWIVG